MSFGDLLDQSVKLGGASASGSRRRTAALLFPREGGIGIDGPANIYLDALDRELERRGHRFSRCADDCNIYVGSQAAAERVLESVQEWIEKHLRLEVNATKSW